MVLRLHIAEGCAQTYSDGRNISLNKKNKVTTMRGSINLNLPFPKNGFYIVFLSNEQ